MVRNPHLLFHRPETNHQLRRQERGDSSQNVGIPLRRTNVRREWRSVTSNCQLRPALAESGHRTAVGIFSRAQKKQTLATERTVFCEAINEIRAGELFQLAVRM